MRTLKEQSEHHCGPGAFTPARPISNLSEKFWSPPAFLLRVCQLLGAPPTVDGDTPPLGDLTHTGEGGRSSSVCFQTEVLNCRRISFRMGFVQIAGRTARRLSRYFDRFSKVLRRSGRLEVRWLCRSGGESLAQRPMFWF